MAKRTFAAIARDIKSNWAKPYFGAVPYIEAMLTIETTDPKSKYFLEDIGDIALRFLANAKSFRGEKARELKEELRVLLL